MSIDWKLIDRPINKYSHMAKKQYKTKQGTGHRLVNLYTYLLKIAAFTYVRYWVLVKNTLSLFMCSKDTVDNEIVHWIVAKDL